MADQTSLSELSLQLREGRISARAVVDACLARIADPAGEGARTFITVNAEAARNQATRVDLLRDSLHNSSRNSSRNSSHNSSQGGHDALGPLAGIPLAIKDLFDCEGEVTTAGSVLLSQSAPATRDAVAVARLRAAGMIPIGRTNMSEFAFSGLGLNPHYGTPANPWDRAAARIPGGSSSGAAISITDGMAYAALGTDTGGSCRIPAALTGIVGYKPTASRVPTEGAFPLSDTLDSVGPLARSVACCAALFEVLAQTQVPLTEVDWRSVRLLVPKRYLLDDLDPHVARAFEAALRRFSQAGATLIEADLATLADLAAYNAKGGFPAAEAFFHHRRWLADRNAAYDPRVRARILRGEQQSAADYLRLLADRRRFIKQIESAMTGYDAMLFPTVPRIAPTIASVDSSDEQFGKVNLLMLRNSTVVNFFDGCAVSIPIHDAGTAPVGLTLAGLAMADEHVLRMAHGAQRIVSAQVSRQGAEA